MIKIKEKEAMIQYLIGYLVTNTRSLDYYIHTQEFDIPNFNIPEEIKDIIHNVVMIKKKRIRILSDILDKRLYKRVLLFFPLSAKIMEEGMLNIKWVDFRNTLSNHRWNDAYLYALDFIKYITNKNSLFYSENEFFVSEVIRYETSILEVLNNAKEIRYSLSSMSDSKRDCNYPLVMTNPVYHTYDFDIVTLIAKLRENDDVDIELSYKKILKNEKNNILTYMSWHDQKVRTIRISSLVIKLIKECHYRSTYKEICNEIFPSVLSDNDCLKIDLIFNKLESLGVIRWFSNIH
ncbi:hypothetical protein [Xenorhabdus sp. Sc-CR9]|uniref:hypothetical protein n=1 Tax=Xenorhabdus sp. Sc-CR9 TaxID=2584468 RepID=UPI001F17C983|nr:hypothetical protein [Xenorhabdus sp. Sc-CR9]